jgi:hypoxanthine phosphoribosyltransferase
MLSADKAWEVLNTAELICDEETVQSAVRTVAAQISSQLKDSSPLVLSVMGGGVVFTGQILPLLKFPLEFDYVHVTRYAGTTRGGEIQWKTWPNRSIAGRIVLVLDDILDEGHTLSAIRGRLLAEGAAGCYLAVFADKKIGREKPVRADFVGIEVPDRYVFGMGMDVEGAWRNLPAIYALRDHRTGESC